MFRNKILFSWSLLSQFQSSRRIECNWKSFERYFAVLLVGFLISYNITAEYIYEKDYEFFSLATINTNICSLFIVPLVFSIDINIYEMKHVNLHHRKLLLYIDLFVFNILLLNIVFELQYGLLTYFIDSTISVNVNDLFTQTTWRAFGFCNKFWISKLMKMFAVKILHHQRCVGPLKCRHVPYLKWCSITRVQVLLWQKRYQQPINNWNDTNLHFKAILLRQQPESNETCFVFHWFLTSMVTSIQPLFEYIQLYSLYGEVFTVKLTPNDTTVVWWRRYTYPLISNKSK